MITPLISNSVSAPWQYNVCLVVMLTASHIKLDRSSGVNRALFFEFPSSVPRTVRELAQVLPLSLLPFSLILCVRSMTIVCLSVCQQHSPSVSHVFGVARKKGCQCNKIMVVSCTSFIYGCREADSYWNFGSATLLIRKVKTVFT